MKDDKDASHINTGSELAPSSKLSAHKAFTFRVLATTDLHVQLLGYDYVNDRSVGHNGLAGLATLIEAARNEGVPTLLVDNGDLLQGSALGETLAQRPVTPDHPIIASLNALSYDVIGVGNHDLDYGLTYLQRIVGLTKAPFISTNLELDADTAIARSTIVPCKVKDDVTSELRSLQVGFLSVLPQLTNIWNKPMLNHKGWVKPARVAVEEALPELKAQGADVAILLAHMGIEDSLPGDDVRQLATIPGVDALIAGHTHQRLPVEDPRGFQDVDVDGAALGSYAAAMPGFSGSDLAVLDLSLRQTDTGEWQVTNHAVQLRANTADVPANPKIVSLCTPAHNQTRALLSEPLGVTSDPIHNFFSLAAPTQTCALHAAAKQRIVQDGLKDKPESELPLLTAVSAHTAGGRGGPDHYINIPSGKVFRRAVAGLSPYSNKVCALRITGAELRSWLEHTVGVFAHLAPDQPDQPLLRADRPAFHFDTIYGIRYAIDPTQTDGRRVSALTYENEEISDDQIFVIATSEFRAAGGGGGPQFGEDQVVFSGARSVNDAFFANVDQQALKVPALHAPWSFSCASPVQGLLHTSPKALKHMAEIAHLNPEPLDIDANGFLPVRLSLPVLN